LRKRRTYLLYKRLQENGQGGKKPKRPQEREQKENKGKADIGEFEGV
jgi:hypothetical protein